MNDSILREHVRRLLDWSDAHVDFTKAVADVPPELRGARVDPFPHTLWQLVEHIRIAQSDLLDFCRNSGYAELRWPVDYWPPTEVPFEAGQWEASVAHVEKDRLTLQALALDPDLDLTVAIPHGSGQTYLRELLLAADHTAYHVGQIVALRRLLGIWGA